MTSLIRFTPLSGAWNEDPLCYLLQIDECSILLDCGWTDQFRVDHLEVLQRHAKQIDLILLSHGDMDHLGGLVYAVKTFGMQCPIYATLPVVNMGRLCLKDVIKSRLMGEHFDRFTAEDVDSVFDKIVQLKFMENVALIGKCQGIVITPFIAGHTLGGTVWRIKKDTDDIVYAVNFNHRKERHLNGSILESVSRPSLLITDAYNMHTQLVAQKQRDKDLINLILNALRNDGNVLIPVDSSLRVLEIAYLLDQLWAFHQLNFPLLLVTTESVRTIEYAKGMLEWMGDVVTKQFATTRETPFDFKFLKLCQSLHEIEKFQSPKVILASTDSLETGFSRDLFIASAAFPQNLVLLTGRGYPGSLMRKLHDMQSADSPSKKSETLKITVNKRIPLEGEELSQHFEKEREKKERLELEEQVMARKKRILEGDEEFDIEMDDIDQQMLFIGDRFDHFNRGNKTTGFSFFVNDSKTALFPCNERKPKYDDYGEIIDPSVYLQNQAELLNLQEQEQENNMPVDVPEEVEIPSKPISFSLDLPLRCSIRSIDFEGLSDGKSVKNILKRISPKKLIIVRGNSANTANLRQFAIESANITSDIFTPKIDQSVNVSSASNIFQLKLTDALVSSLTFAKLNDYELAFVRGQTIYETTEDAEVVPADEALVERIPLVDLCSLADRWRSHTSVCIGDVKLTEMKRLLQLEGIPSDFVRGSLLIGKRREIRVQKNENGDLTVEGPFCGEFYKVRSCLYQLHAVI